MTQRTYDLGALDWGTEFIVFDTSHFMNGRCLEMFVFGETEEPMVMFEVEVPVGINPPEIGPDARSLVEGTPNLGS